LNSASKTAEAEEDRLQVLAVLSQLPGSQQLMLEWKHVDGLSIREISERAGQTEKSVESTLYRARK
jgi:RNA polymerase sigma factor (sigma-70 family)